MIRKLKESHQKGYMKNIIKESCEKFKIDYKFVKFLFVGGINTAFGYCVFSLFLFMGLHYSAAAFFATILGVLFNFKTTGWIVFKSRDNSLLFKFFGVYVVTYLVNVLGLSIFNQFKANLYIAGLIMIFPCAIISFLLMKNFVFNKGEPCEK